MSQQPEQELSSQGQKDTSYVESKSGPGVTLEFIGYFHLPLNLQVVPLIAEDLESVVNQTRGETFIYLEYASLPQRVSTAASRMIKSRGLQETRIGMELAKALGRPASEREIQEHKQTLASNNLATVMRTSPLSAQKFFLDKEIDRIRKGRRVQVEFEGHSDADTTKINNLIDELDSVQSSLGWGKGPLVTSLGKTRRVIELDVEQSLVREASVMDSLARKVTELKKKGGSVVILWGINHMGMLEAIQRKADPSKTYVKDRIILHGPSNDYDFLAMQLVRNNEEPSEEMLARVFFGNECFNAVANLFLQGGGKLEDFANNFDTIRAAVWDVAQSLSLEDIGRLNDSRTSVLTPFFEHEAARVALPFLR